MTHYESNGAENSFIHSFLWCENIRVNIVNFLLVHLDVTDVPDAIGHNKSFFVMYSNIPIE